MVNWWEEEEDSPTALRVGSPYNPDLVHPADELDGFTKVATDEPEMVVSGEQPAIMPRPEGNTDPKPAVSTGIKGFNPNSAMADRYKSIVEEYQPDSYRQGELHTPQQYGQEGSAIDPEERPLDPEETAKRISAGENRIVNLGPKGIPSVIKSKADGYQQYAEVERSKRDDERRLQNQRAVSNRANMDARSSRTQQAMLDTNRMQGANVGEPMSAFEGGGPGMSRMGGMSIVKGRWRPRTEEESADLDIKKAQAEYYRSRPETDRAKVGVTADKEKGVQGRHEATLDAKKQAEQRSMAMRKEMFDSRIALDKMVAESRVSGDQAKLGTAKAETEKRIASIGQILKIKMAAGEKRGMFGFGSPDPGARDFIIDPDTKQPTTNRAEGDFSLYKQALTSEIERLASIDPNAELPQEVDELIEQLSKL